MHHPQQRPSSTTSSNCSKSIPATQAQALERRHLLDEQQRAFRGTHANVRGEMVRRRPPA